MFTQTFDAFSASIGAMAVINVSLLNVLNVSLYFLARNEKLDNPSWVNPLVFFSSK